MKKMQGSQWLFAAVAAVMIGCNPAQTTDAGQDVTGNDVTGDIPSNPDTGGNDVQNPTDGSGGGCAAHTDCLSCTADFACGFCADTHTCMEGVSSGPNTGTCTTWQYLRSDCPDYDAGPPPNCGTATNCADCTAMSSCGWCGASGTCLAGTASGSTTGACMPSGDAGSPTWAWLDTDCPAGDAGTGDASHD